MKRKFLKFLCLFLVVFTGVSLNAQVTNAATPKAMRATSGIGLHKERIWWLNWDVNNNNNAAGTLGPWDNLKNGVVSTFTSPAGFTYTITLSNVQIFNNTGTDITNQTSGVLASSRTTSYSGNNFPTAYAGFTIGGINENVITISQKNESVSTNTGDGNRATFRLTVTAVDPLGNSGNATGIVLAGSESLDGINEWYKLTAPTGRIRVIDKYILSTANWNNYSVQIQASNANRYLYATNPSGGNSKGDVMMFAEDVPYVDVEVKGTGGQSIAVGFLEELDYSDAPASYGRAYHLIENKFTGGLFNDGNTNLNTLSNTADITSVTGQLAKFVDPTLRLGADIDGEDLPTLPAAGANPNVDDNSESDDEDALPSTTAGINGYYGIKYVNISPLTSYLSFWIDKNRNGTFDTDEKVTRTIPPNKTGTAILDITSLNIPTGNNYYARIRYSSTPNLGPIGYAADGEVEDHFVNITNTTFSILGNVFLDNNSNIPDGVPLDNITVELYDNGNNLVATTLTNYEGAYVFYNLSNGTYRVKVVLPASPSYKHVTSTDATPNDGETTVIVNNANVLGINFGLFFTTCYKESPTTSGGLPTNHGITALGRAGDDNGNWPMVRTGAWTALEAKTKGFVINRVAANFEAPTGDGQVPSIANPVKGMIIYDTTNYCLKIYTGTTWKCFSIQGCPTIN